MRVPILYSIWVGVFLWDIVAAGDGKTCTEFLTKEQCSRLQEIAKDIGLSSSSVLDGLIDSRKEKELSKLNLYTRVIRYLDAKFMCHILLTKELCNNLQQVISNRDISFLDVETNIRANIAKGFKTKKELYKKVLDFIYGFDNSHPVVVVSDERTCTGVLSEKQCEKLKEIAVDIGLSPTAVGEGLKDSSKQKQSPNLNIYTRIIKYMDAKFMCQILLSKELCNNLRQVISSRDISFLDVETNIRANIAKGFKTKKELYKKVLDFIYVFDNSHPVVIQKDGKTSCIGKLSEEQCKKLKETAKSLDLPTSAVIDGYNDISNLKNMAAFDIYGHITQYLDAVFMCNILLTKKLCASLHQTSVKHHLSFLEVETNIQANMAKGIRDKKANFAKVIEFIKTHSNDDQALMKRAAVGSKCNQVLSEHQCKKLTKIAIDIGLPPTAVGEGLRDSSKQKESPNVNVYTRIIKYLDAKFMCQVLLSKEVCNNLQNIISTRDISFLDVETNIQANIAKGIKDKKLIFARVLDYIFGFDNLRDEEYDTIASCSDVLPKEQCVKLEEIAQGVDLPPSVVIDGLNDAKQQKNLAHVDYFAKVVEYIDSLFMCPILLTKELCNKLKLSASKHKVPFHDVQINIQAELVQGVKDKDKIFKNVKDFILGLGNLDDDVAKIYPYLNK